MKVLNIIVPLALSTQSISNAAPNYGKNEITENEKKQNYLTNYLDNKTFDNYSNWYNDYNATINHLDLQSIPTEITINIKNWQTDNSKIKTQNPLVNQIHKQIWKQFSIYQKNSNYHLSQYLFLDKNCKKIVTDKNLLSQKNIYAMISNKNILNKQIVILVNLKLPASMTILQPEISLKKINRTKRYNICDERYLDDEWTFYYNENQVFEEICTDWGYKEPAIRERRYYLGDIDPINFLYIEFMGGYELLSNTRISWGTDAYYAPYNLHTISYNKHLSTRKMLRNIKLCPPYDDVPTYMSLQPLKTEQSGVSWIQYRQDLSLTYFAEDHGYYLQVISRQECISSRLTTQGGSAFINLGTGIRFHN